MTQLDETLKSWTSEQWLAEAVYRYGRATVTMGTWVEYGKTGPNGDAIYKAAASATQRAIAAAAIATAKLAQERT